MKDLELTGNYSVSIPILVQPNVIGVTGPGGVGRNE